MNLKKGVQFSLIAEILTTGSKTEKSMAHGGNFIVNNFKAVVETGKPTLSGRMILDPAGFAAPVHAFVSLPEYKFTMHPKAMAIISGNCVRHERIE
ncbi:MAG: hypothetical protein ACR2P1_20720 [Pseudomonadales bacterium]